MIGNIQQIFGLGQRLFRILRQQKVAVGGLRDRASNSELSARFELMPVITSTITRSCVDAVVGGFGSIHVRRAIPDSSCPV